MAPISACRHDLTWLNLAATAKFETQPRTEAIFFIFHSIICLNIYSRIWWTRSQMDLAGRLKMSLSVELENALVTIYNQMLDIMLPKSRNCRGRLEVLISNDPLVLRDFTKFPFCMFLLYSIHNRPLVYEANETCWLHCLSLSGIAYLLATHNIKWLKLLTKSTHPKLTRDLLSGELSP